MWKHRSPPKTTNMAPTGGLFATEQRPEDNVGAWDNNIGNMPSKDTQFRQPPNQCHPPPGYSYPPSQSPFPGAPQIYHPAPFNMTPSSQTSSGATKGCPSYGPSWQACDFPQGGHGGPQMFPPQQFTGQGPSSPGAPWVPPALPGNIPVIRPRSSASTPYGQIPATSRRPPPLASQWKYFSQLRNCTWQLLQGLRICPHHQRFPMKSLMQIMRVMIRRTWAGLKAKPQSAWSKRNSPWSNLPTGWGSPILECSTCGRMYGWLGFGRRSIGPLSRDRTVWNSCEMDPCNGRWRLEWFCRLSRRGDHWKFLILLNGFGDTALRCCWRNAQVMLGTRERWGGEATSHRRWIWESARAHKWEVTSQSCRI